MDSLLAGQAALNALNVLTRMLIAVAAAVALGVAALAVARRLAPGRPGLARALRVTGAGLVVVAAALVALIALAWLQGGRVAHEVLDFDFAADAERGGIDPAACLTVSGGDAYCLHEGELEVRARFAGERALELRARYASVRFSDGRIASLNVLSEPLPLAAALETAGALARAWQAPDDALEGWAGELSIGPSERVLRVEGPDPRLWMAVRRAEQDSPTPCIVRIEWWWDRPVTSPDQGARP